MNRFIILSVLALTACGSSATGPGNSLAGAYELGTVNGAQLPAILSVAGSDTTYLASQILIVQAAGTYQTSGVEVLTHGSAFGTPVSVTSSGTYTANGSGYSFTDKTLGAGAGSLSHGMLTVNFSGVVYVFGLVQ